jgi:hypothetical protein
LTDTVGQLIDWLKLKMKNASRLNSGYLLDVPSHDKQLLNPLFNLHAMLAHDALEWGVNSHPIDWRGFWNSGAVRRSTSGDC